MLYQGASCCGYGINGMAVNGFDCAVIPGARKVRAQNIALLYEVNSKRVSIVILIFF